MKKRFRSSVLNNMQLRVIALTCCVSLNALTIFYHVVLPKDIGSLAEEMILPIISAAVILLCNFISDAGDISSAFKSLDECETLLGSKKPLKYIIARILSVTLLDLLSYGIFALCVGVIALQALHGVAGFSFNLTSLPKVAYNMVVVIIGYFELISYAFLMVAVKSDFQSRLPRFLAPMSGFLGVALVAYILSLLDFALIPFGVMEREGLLFVVHVAHGNKWAGLACVLINAVKLVAVVSMTGWLLERRLDA